MNKKGSITASKINSILNPEYIHVILLACFASPFCSFFVMLNASFAAKYSLFFLSIYKENAAPITVPNAIEKIIIGAAEKVISSKRRFLPITYNITAKNVNNGKVSTDGFW